MRKSSVIYKSLTILSLLTGILLNIYNSKSVIDVISYYTSQSTIICLISFILFLYLEVSQKNISPKIENLCCLLKGTVVIGIAVTMICYNLALSPTGFDMTTLHRHTIIAKMTDLIVHTLSPCLVILDYFFFDIKGKFKIHYPIIWLILPIYYVFFVYIYSDHGGKFTAIGGSEKYAYFFLDYEKIGIFGVCKWVLFIGFCILVLSYLFVFVDNQLSKKVKKE